MTRVLFLAERTEIPDEQIEPHGSSAHVASTLAALRARFDVLAIGPEPGQEAPSTHPAIHAFVPARVRGLRRDFAFARADRAFAHRALAAAAAFEPDVVYERDEYFALAGRRVARRLGVPLVLEVNGLLAADARTMYRSLAEQLGAVIERKKLHRADAVVTVSPGLAERLVALGAPRARVTVVPNTVGEERLAPVVREASEDTVVVGWIGHLMDWHADALLRLVEVAPGVVAEADVRFRVIGDGPRLEEVRELARVLGVADRFDFVGSVEYDDVPRALTSIDVGVIPDVFDYAFPVKLVEMGAAGLPVVAPRSASLDAQLVPG
ncbi:MAG TPA: glycosyltransferase, partial [Gaiellaceae bacterium]|nr:glycosyltransferase [Gaiellaceae bacterium]